MAIKIKELIKILKKKDQNAEVEFVVVTTDGKLVCMDINAAAKDMSDLLKMFGSGT